MAGRSLGDMHLGWFEHILSPKFIPQTISIPYSHIEWSLPREYARSLCSLFAQLSSQGRHCPCRERQ